MTRSQRSRNVHVPLEEKTLGSSDTDGINKIEANTMLGQVLRAMRQLPERDRAVLAIVCIEGLSYKDCAETLGVPIGTVMSRLARARHRLYKLLYRKDASMCKH